MKKYVVCLPLPVSWQPVATTIRRPTMQIAAPLHENGSSAGDLSQNPDYTKGLELIGASDCYTCHKTEEKLVGPAYVDVANKYAGQDTALAYLSHKVITGGSGVWGEVAMTPHPQLSQEQAEQMVKYILLLKTK